VLVPVLDLAQLYAGRTKTDVSTVTAESLCLHLGIHATSWGRCVYSSTSKQGGPSGLESGSVRDYAGISLRPRYDAVDPSDVANLIKNGDSLRACRREALSDEKHRGRFSNRSSMILAGIRSFDSFKALSPSSAVGDMGCIPSRLTN
jgi:hypothetical protein